MGTAVNIQSQLATNISRTNFVVDTNVLYWMFYENCNYSDSYQKCYQEAVVRLKIKNNNLIVSTISLYELFSIIEKNEFNIFKKTHKKDTDFKLKDYRKIPEERRKIKKLLNITYKNISQFTKIMGYDLSNQDVTNLCEDYESHNLDVFDYTLVNFCKQNRISNIITDDRDYRSALNDLNIYTANRNYF